MDLFTAVNNYGYTENGALTYKSSLNKNLDLFSMGGASRNRGVSDIFNLINNAYNEDPKTCIKILLFLRDIREGVGEKRIYRLAINELLKKNVNSRALLEATIEVGSWKDVFLSFPFEVYAPFVKERYIEHKATGKYDLMEKYMPSIGGKYNKPAEMLAKYLGLTFKEYRKYLAKARKYLNIVETNLVNKSYENIDYSKLPSKAGLIYRNAFYRNDADRYREFIASVSQGKAKMNTSTLAPYEILKRLIGEITYGNGKVNDDELLAIETTWQEFFKKTIPSSRGIVVADVSGSMWGTPLNVAISLGMLFAERNTGIFHNKLITFSRNPNFITYEDSDSLRARIKKIVEANWDMNTNLQAVFDLILRTAKENHLPEEELPNQIYIVSDMEFDACASHTNLEEIKRKYAESGYDFPNVIFWNVNSRQDNIPCKFNEKGVGLVSGASANIFNLVVEGELDPIRLMNNSINKERYESMTNLICTV